MNAKRKRAKTSSGDFGGNLGGFKLHRPTPAPGQCPECHVFHEPELPHDQQSLFWQYHFRELHGRWPTWADALAHCTPEIRQLWIDELAERGIIVEQTKNE